jgi:flagellar motor switch/type III secretory pathway protein FliN
MTVSPLSFEGLPHLPPAAVGRSRALARALAGTTLTRTLSLRGLGEVTLRVHAVDVAPWSAAATRVADGASAPACALTLVRDGLAGRIEVDAFLALSLVRATLGAPAPLAVRPLGPSERGVLAAVVAAALLGLGASAIETSPWSPAQLSGDQVQVELGVEGEVASGRVRLALPLAWLEAPGRAGLLAGAGLIATELRLELARTSLDRLAFAGASAGDALVFEGVSAPDGTSAWPCLIWIGAHRAAGEVLPGGELRRTGAFVVGQEERGTDMTGQDDGIKGAAADAEEARAVLAAAPVEIVAELGRVSLRGDEVMGLVRGAVLPLGPRRRDLVTLRVGDRLWARGELVTLDDQLGVRLVELFPPG